MKAHHLALLSTLAAAPSAAADVTWMVFPTPITFIADGPTAGQGAADRQLQYLFQRMPQYRNHVLHATFTRIWTEMASRDGVCTHIAFRSPEREKAAIFTARPMKLTGYRLLAHPGDIARLKPYLTESEEIDLPRLLQSPEFRGSYIAARLLPPAVSAALADKDQVKADMTPMQTPRQILQSFNAGRLDFFIALPIEADFYRDLGDLPHITLPIKGVEREVSIYSACSNAPLGRAEVRAIDRIQRVDKNWVDFMAPFQDYIDPADFAESLTSRPDRSAIP